MACRSKYSGVFLLFSANLLVGLFVLQTRRQVVFVEDNYSSGSSEGIGHHHTDQDKLLPINLNISSTPLSVSSLLPVSVVATETFPHPYHYVIANEHLCSRGREQTKVTNLDLLVLVCSAVENFKARESIRNTWGSIALPQANNNTGHVRLGFLLGSTENSTLQMLVEMEQAKESDLVQEDFVDSYLNLTLKSVMLLKWVTDFCPGVSFVLKTDDDMYVNLGKLLTTLASLPVKKNIMYGNLFRKARPDRNERAKWYVPKEQFPGDVFPDYLSGTGYVVSGDVIPSLLAVSHTVPFLAMEDIFITGLCANVAGVRRVNVGGFTYLKRPPTGCAFKEAITGHQVTIEDRRKIWNELQNPQLFCSSKRTNRRIS